MRDFVFKNGLIIIVCHVERTVSATPVADGPRIWAERTMALPRVPAFQYKSPDHLDPSST